MYNDFEIEWGYTPKKQVDYATELPDVDLTKGLFWLGPDIQDRDAKHDTDADEFGKGHPYTTKQRLLSWDNKVPRHFKGTAEAIGFITAFASGACVSTQPNLPGNPLVYSHAITPATFASTKDMVVTTIVEKLAGVRTRKVPSIAVADFTLSGEGVQYIDLQANLVGSGKQATFAGSMPTPVEGNFLWTVGLELEWSRYANPLAAISAQLKKWSFAWDNAPRLDDGYFPGSGFVTAGVPSSGAIRGRLERGTPKMTLSLTFRAEDDSVLTDWEENVEMKARITATGEVITVGQPETYQMILDLYKFKIKKPQVVFVDGVMCYQITTEVMYDSVAAKPWLLTVVNKDTGYML